jgi:hypothetical protein
MASTSDSERALNAALPPIADTSPTVPDSLSSRKEDSLLGLNKKQVILENSLLAGGNTNVSPLENSEKQNVSSSSQEFIVNERSNMPQINCSPKIKQDDSPDSCSVVLGDEGK